MQCSPRLCHGPKFHLKPNYPLNRRTLRMLSRVPMISRLAASSIFVCSPTMSGCPTLHRKSRLSLSSISPLSPLSVPYCRRRNSLLVLSVMFVSWHVTIPLSRVPSPAVTVECRSVPLSKSLAPVLNPAQPRLPRTDRESELPLRLAPVRKKAPILVLITSAAIVRSSYGGDCVVISRRDSSNSKPKRSRVAKTAISSIIENHS